MFKKFKKQKNNQKQFLLFASLSRLFRITFAFVPHHFRVCSAFTLVEALVAISILMIAIASPMLLAQKGLSIATLSKDQMIASFLAQDAIEAVKNIRDQIAVSRNSPNDWLTGNENEFFKPCICNGTDCDFDSASPKFCYIDTTRSIWDNTNSITSTVKNPPKLKISHTSSPDSLFLKYDHEGTMDSKFTRYINIKKTVGNENEAIINVRVSWDSPLGIQKVEIQDFIYNYSENL